MLPFNRLRPWLSALLCWNWKAAIIAAVLRGGACMAALPHAQLHARQHFSAIEMVYVLATSGFFSGLQQQALGIQKKRYAWITVVLFIPMISLGADLLLHKRLDGSAGTAFGAGALAVTLLSAMFHWHVMQKGAMLVGRQGKSFGSDLKQMPALLMSFFASMLAFFPWRRRTETEVERVKLEIAA